MLERAVATRWRTRSHFGGAQQLAGIGALRRNGRASRRATASDGGMVGVIRVTECLTCRSRFVALLTHPRDKSPRPQARRLRKQAVSAANDVAAIRARRRRQSVSMVAVKRRLHGQESVVVAGDHPLQEPTTATGAALKPTEHQKSQACAVCAHSPAVGRVTRSSGRRTAASDGRGQRGSPLRRRGRRSRTSRRPARRRRSARPGDTSG